MKFKNLNRNGYDDIKGVPVIKDRHGYEFIVETRADGKPGLFISSPGIYLTRNKALKLARAIINELDPLG